MARGSIESDKLLFCDQRLQYGQQKLWKRELTEARRAFQSCIKQLRRLRKTCDDALIRPLEREAELGLWALDYFQNQSLRSSYRNVVGSDNLDLRAWTFIANVFFVQEDASSTAQEAYLALLKLKPDPELARKIAPLALEATDSVETTKLLKRIVELDAGNTDVLARLCHFYLQQDQLSSAKHVAETIIKEEPGHPFALESLAYIAEMQGDWKTAADYYQGAQRWAGALRAAVRAGDRSAAAKIREHVKADAAEPETLANLGWSHYLDGDIQNAMTCWQKVNTSGDLVQGGDVFTWLEGMRLLATDPVTAHRRLRTATSANSNGSSVLTPEIVSATNWLVSQLGEPESDATQPGKDNVLLKGIGQEGTPANALLPAYVLTLLQNAETPNSKLLEGNHPSASWQNIKLLAYAQMREWETVLSLIAQNSGSELADAILAQFFTETKGRKNWSGVEQAVASISPNSIGKPVKAAIASIESTMWEERELERLATVLLKQLSHGLETRTQVHHDLALVLTRLAIQRDASVVDTSLWRQATSHWAVALSDDHYWDDWQDERSKIYGAKVTKDQVAVVRERVVPDFLRTYHEQFLDKKQIREASAQGARKYLGAYIRRELELAGAVRRVLAAASTQRIQIPPPVESLISPTLLKEHGDQQAINELLRLLPQTKASHYDQQLLKQAFSKLADMYVFIEAELYDSALQLVRRAHQQQPTSKETKAQLLNVMRLKLQAHIDHAEWSQAIDLGKEAFQIISGDVETERLVAEAAVGWAKDVIEKDCLSTIKMLRNVRALFRHRSTELDAMLCDALVSHAVRLYDQQRKPAEALRHAQEALGISPEHVRAKRFAALVYHNWALEKVQKNYYASAISDAKKALEYMSDADTHYLLAGAYCETKNWNEASRHAQVALDLEPNQERFDFWVWVRCRYATSLSYAQQYRSAIAVLREILNLPHESEAINVRELLSAVHTDYGAALANSRQIRAAQEQWRLALKYDASNATARHNLRITGGHWW